MSRDSASERPPALSAQTGRIAELDGIRGVAILLVLNTHAGLIASSTGAMIGVTLFFVLSGFLITRLLLIEESRTGSITLPAFYARRALRLLPALMVYLIGIALLAYWRRVDIPILDMSWPPALYVANYVQIFGQDIFANRHTWSLAVEEHFYLAWPLLLALGAARRTRWLAISVVVLLAWRFAVAFVDPFWAYHGTDTNAYALGIGCLLAVARSQGRLPLLPRRSAEFGFGLLLLLAVLPFRPNVGLIPVFVWLPTLAALLSGLIIVAAVQRGAPVFRSRVLGWFGLISYALYLWHAPLLQFPGLSETLGRRVMTAGIAIALASLSWVLLEGPIMRSSWRRKVSIPPAAPVPG